MSTHQRCTSLGACLEDPFVTKIENGFASLSVSKRVPSEDGEIIEDTDGEQSTASSPTLFGNAPLYAKPSSAVKLPSSPSSRKLSTGATSLSSNPSPQRVLSSSLSANAVPFLPKAISLEFEMATGRDSRATPFVMSRNYVHRA